MKSVQVQPLSIIIGVVLAAVGFLALGLTPPQAAGQGVRIEYGPHPRDMMRVEEGSPFTVPSGKIFVVTGAGSDFIHDTQGATRCDVVINGNTIIGAAWYETTLPSAFGLGHSVVPVPPGLIAVAGEVILALDDGPKNGVIFGYLADA